MLLIIHHYLPTGYWFIRMQIH